MSDEKGAYEGTISMDYRKKEIIKVNIILFLVATSYLIVTFVLLYLFEPGFSFELFVLLMFLFVVLPHVFTFIFVASYNKTYVKTFSYIIQENNIIVNHGVFTKTRATIPYSRIQNINIVNGIFDRIFKTYTVKIETAGSSAAASSAQSGISRPEGYIPGLKDPHVIEAKIKEMLTKYSQIPSGLEDKIFKPEELAFDNFISYILSKMREGERLRTSIKELREKANMAAAQLAEKVGVPIQTINYLEEGRYNPSLVLAYKIAETLNCKIEDLFKMV